LAGSNDTQSVILDRRQMRAARDDMNVSSSVCQCGTKDATHAACPNNGNFHDH
jgi:hypothetical protein